MDTQPICWLPCEIANKKNKQTAKYDYTKHLGTFFGEPGETPMHKHTKKTLLSLKKYKRKNTNIETNIDTDTHKYNHTHTDTHTHSISILRIRTTWDVVVGQDQFIQFREDVSQIRRQSRKVGINTQLPQLTTNRSFLAHLNQHGWLRDSHWEHDF